VRIVLHREFSGLQGFYRFRTFAPGAVARLEDLPCSGDPNMQGSPGNGYEREE
jgi:hypothetical protein